MTTKHRFMKVSRITIPISWNSNCFITALYFLRIVASNLKDDQKSAIQPKAIIAYRL